jgi:hypothetical protein
MRSLAPSLEQWWCVEEAGDVGELVGLLDLKPSK